MINDKSMLKLTVAGLAVILMFFFTCSAYASLADKYPGDVGIEGDPNVVGNQSRDRTLCRSSLIHHHKVPAAIQYC